MINTTQGNHIQPTLHPSIPYPCIMRIPLKLENQGRDENYFFSSSFFIGMVPFIGIAIEGCIMVMWSDIASI